MRTFLVTRRAKQTWSFDGIPWMDFQILRNRNELQSTGFMEIGPGKYGGLHWQDGFIFVWEDAFGVAEGIVERHFPAYDHLGMNDLPKDTVTKIISDWRSAADHLPNLGASDLQRELNLFSPQLAGFVREIDSQRFEIAAFFKSLAVDCENFLRQSNWVCILGI